MKNMEWTDWGLLALLVPLFAWAGIPVHEAGHYLVERLLGADPNLVVSLSGFLLVWDGHNVAIEMAGGLTAFVVFGGLFLWLRRRGLAYALPPLLVSIFNLSYGLGEPFLAPAIALHIGFAFSVLVGGAYCLVASVRPSKIPPGRSKALKKTWWAGDPGPGDQTARSTPQTVAIDGLPRRNDGSPWEIRVNGREGRRSEVCTTRS